MQQQWKKSLIDDRRRQLSDTIEALAKDHPKIPKARLILSAMTDLAKGDDLGQFILALRCLIEHRTNPELRDSEVARLAELAKNILIKEGIKPKSSKLSYLYENLFLVLSQIDAENNRMFQAGWNQMLALYFLEAGTSDHPAKHQLAAAIRRFHLGFIDSAMKFVDRVLIEENVEPRERAHAATLRLRFLHVGGKSDLFEAFVQQANEICKDFPDFMREVAWEQLIKTAIATSDLSQLVREVGKSRPFYAPSFILEAHLVVLTKGTKHDRAKLELLSTIDNRRDISFRDLESLRYAVGTLHECYDREIPIHHRLMKLGNVLTKIDGIKSIFHQLLVLAASLRWLNRSRLEDFADFCTDGFYSRGLCTSGGRSKDPLGLLTAIVPGDSGED